ncbi:hypothetical protein [Actinacidiphila yeochonensis]|uniref:hypothetical protein n=1 Tax=Actinacidiphila yeochonensis TaxID=89050 RepID=UPI00056A94B1|nr:hypothetical protein [Actinacidiphila yeochonensis]
MPSGYDGFLKLDSAKTFQGNTVVNISKETCKVNANDDEDVEYTAITSSQAYVFSESPSVKVLSGTDLESVAPSWLVSHQLENTPYFAYRLNSASQITTLEEIYHP